MDWIYIPHIMIDHQIWCGWRDDMWFCTVLKEERQMKWTKHIEKENMEELSEGKALMTVARPSQSCALDVQAPSGWSQSLSS